MVDHFALALVSGSGSGVLLARRGWKSIAYRKEGGGSRVPNTMSRRIDANGVFSRQQRGRSNASVIEEREKPSRKPKAESTTQTDDNAEKDQY